EFLENILGVYFEPRISVKSVAFLLHPWNVEAYFFLSTVACFAQYIAVRIDRAVVAPIGEHQTILILRQQRAWRTCRRRHDEQTCTVSLSQHSCLYLCELFGSQWRLKHLEIDTTPIQCFRTTNEKCDRVLILFHARDLYSGCRGGFR